MKDVLKELSRKEKFKVDRKSVRRFNDLAKEVGESENDSQRQVIKQLSKDIRNHADITTILSFQMLSRDLVEKGEELARFYSDAASAFMNLSRDEEDKEFAEITALNVLKAKDGGKSKVLRQLEEFGF